MTEGADHPLGVLAFAGSVSQKVDLPDFTPDRCFAPPWGGTAESFGEHIQLRGVLVDLL